MNGPAPQEGLDPWKKKRCSLGYDGLAYITRPRITTSGVEDQGLQLEKPGSRPGRGKILPTSYRIEFTIEKK